MRIEMRLTISIIPYNRNARKIPQQAIDKVAASNSELSFRQPIVLDKDGVIIAGHTRWLAAQKLGLERVPVHVADNLTPAQVRAYRLFDNRSHQETSWDGDVLGLELLDLKSMGIDLELTGFDMGEIDDLLSTIDIQGGATDVDAVPDVSDVPVSRLGDLWVLNKHRVLCGDATNKADVDRVVEGSFADMVFCDPPYGVSYTGKTARKLTIQNDDLGAGFYTLLHERVRKHTCGNEGSRLHLHVLFGATYPLPGIHRSRRSLVNFYHLGEESLHVRSIGLPAAIRTNPLRMGGGGCTFLVRGSRSGRRMDR